MSSSLPFSRFPALPLSKEKAATPVVANERPQDRAEHSDESLLAQISVGDQEALAILFRRYYRMVWSIAKRILRNEAEADDLVQDVFLLISRRASVFDSSKGTARSLIALMSYQRAFTRRRYLNARHCQAPVAAEERAAKAAAPDLPLYDQSIEAHFGRERLRKALGEMSEDQRETLRLYFFEGYTLGDIVARLGQSVGNVKHHLYRGLDRLRRQLPGKGSGESQVASCRDQRRPEQARNPTTPTKRPSPKEAVASDQWLVPSERQEQDTTQEPNRKHDDKPSIARGVAVGRFPTPKSGDGNHKTQRQLPEQQERQRQLPGVLYVPEYFTWSRFRRVPGGSS